MVCTACSRLDVDIYNRVNFDLFAGFSGLNVAIGSWGPIKIQIQRQVERYINKVIKLISLFIYRALLDKQICWINCIFIGPQEPMATSRPEK